MIVAIRNLSGFPLFLAVKAGDDEDRYVRLTIFSSKPSKPKRTQRLLHKKDFGINNCPEDARVTIDVSKSKVTLSVHKHKKKRVQGLTDEHEPDGKETYRLYTIRLAN